MRAIIARPKSGVGLVVEEVGAGRAPMPNEALVRAETLLLNQGEVRRALDQMYEGAQPGWDFAGVVERAASDGDGPRVGDRVVGFDEGGAWCERKVVLHAD